MAICVWAQKWSFVHMCPSQAGGELRFSGCWCCHYPSSPPPVPSWSTPVPAQSPHLHQKHPASSWSAVKAAAACAEWQHTGRPHGMPAYHEDRIGPQMSHILWCTLKSVPTHKSQYQTHDKGCYSNTQAGLTTKTQTSCWATFSCPFFDSFSK